MGDITIYFDGAINPVNPGGVASCGWTIHRTEDCSPRAITLCSGCDVESAYKSYSTNNSAEFGALRFALKWLTRHPKMWKVGDHLLMRGDSKLVVECVAGNWVCKKPHLRKLLLKIRTLLIGFGSKWEIEWVPREKNQAADALSQQAYQQYVERMHE